MEAPNVVSLIDVIRHPVEQTVGGGRIGGLHGFLPGQSHSLSAEQIVDNPVPRFRRGFGVGFHGFYTQDRVLQRFFGADHRVPAATAEQNVDIPAPRGAPRDFHQHPLPAAGSSDLLETANHGVFSTFPRSEKKCQHSAHPGVRTGRGLQLMASVSLAGGLPVGSGTDGSTGFLGYNIGRGCFFMVLVADAVLASAVSLWSTLFQTIMAASVRLGRCPHHASAYGCSWKNFLSFALAWFALGIWCIMSVVFVLAVTDTGVWVLF